MYSQDSIDLLANSGLQFQKHEEEGIDTLHFAELLMTSGVVLCDNVKWLSFHSGYDFGYMVKLLTDSRLPEEEHEFFHILNLFFPSIYDVKYLMKSCKNLKGGLQEVADQLDLQRIGRQHQAGSDSLLTGMAFFRMKEMMNFPRQIMLPRPRCSQHGDLSAVLLASSLSSQEVVELSSGGGVLGRPRSD
uniref:poly(A)-specific ribonuclease n=1 Tax=Mus spicilegus TaxID=10103 RepID=A0A8C6GC77_MUSSI